MNWIDEKLAGRKYVENPIRPRLHGNSFEDAKQYAINMEVYEEEMCSYLTIKAECEAHNLAIEQEVEARIKEDSGLNSIPEQYRDKVWRYAWEEGHSAGYHEVQIHLINLVDIFARTT